MKENEYKNISATDNYGIEIITPNNFVIVVNGLADSKRVAFITETLSDIIVKSGVEKFGLGKCSNVGEIKVYNAVKNSNGAFTAVYGSLYTGSTKEIVTTFKNVFLSKQSLFIIFIGIILSIAVLSVMVFRDDKIYMYEEIEAVGLGEACGKLMNKNVVNAVTIKMLSVMLKKEHVNNISFITLGSEGVKIAEEITELINKDQINTDIINIKDDIDGIEKLSNSEKAILIISKGNDKRKDLVDLTKCIKMLNVNYGGYLM